MDIFAFVFVFVLGITVGSFLNVCIYRIPKKQSIVSPRSKCSSCDTIIPWYHNIPVFSYLVLRGKCFSCKESFSPRYLLVEILTGFLFYAVVQRFWLQPFTPALWLLLSLLVVITFIDLDHQIIPDVISLPGIPLGIACSFVIPWVPLVDSLLGVLLGGGILLVIGVVYEWVAKKEGMGGGDVKLLAVIGAFLGWKAIFPIVFFSSLLGALFGVPLILMKKADGKFALPFGPFLAAGTIIYLFFGPIIIQWYLSFFSW